MNDMVAIRARRCQLSHLPDLYALPHGPQRLTQGRGRLACAVASKDAYHSNSRNCCYRQPGLLQNAFECFDFEIAIVSRHRNRNGLTIFVKDVMTAGYMINVKSSSPKSSDQTHWLDLGQSRHELPPAALPDVSRTPPLP